MNRCLIPIPLLFLASIVTTPTQAGELVGFRGASANDKPQEAQQPMGSRSTSPSSPSDAPAFTSSVKYVTQQVP